MLLRLSKHGCLLFIALSFFTVMRVLTPRKKGFSAPFMLVALYIQYLLSSLIRIHELSVDLSISLMRLVW
ncbi:hypothetical protein BDB00DRAFT_848727 [Zychaea mexicana]|uniref:uncharacterized protein n=1 Tax=Zychaea mexicana TaxID=64656 RepID=UPI0022FE63E8|nr:uncharacterized protein BDB00DRAFT_848727 [Zychaea mexicana]KAI9488320.1 hypothetical protein BDB00DRAFT_848727 [Zychaea mexicana]